MSFLIKDDEAREKYVEIWNVIKNKLGIKFYSKPVYEVYLEECKYKIEKVPMSRFISHEL